MLFVTVQLKSKVRTDQYRSIEENLHIFFLGTEEIDHHLVTSQGPATSIVFALTLVELLKGKDEATKVKDGLLA